ncbi:MAG: MerR family transcriptional regulator [Chromatiaceae bacterium]|nr:MerR family transcriptional regulator [Chromatiaceae bacterium]
MENQAPDPRYSIDELCSLANTPRRTVRFYIQQGLLDRPEGQRRGAYYTQRHLEQLLFIARWREAGLSLERIGTLLRDQSEPADLVPRRQPGSVEVWTHLAVAPGVELQLEPERANLSPEQVRAFFKAVMAAYQQVAERPESTSSHPEDSTT